MGNNSNLHKAKVEQNVNFYTRYKDIAEEMPRYRKHFAGKTVYCNCDDPTWSNFWRYFHNNFKSLGLKKLISTHYVEGSEPSYALIYTGGNDFNMEDGTRVPILGDDKYTAGDFRSEACVELLKQADIVVTNPPFATYFREYVEQLIQYNKKFIIIGNKNAVTFKEIFPLIKENKMWIGHRSMNQDFWFRVPDGMPYEKEIEGEKTKHIMACWYTNLDISKRHDGLWHFNGQFDKAKAHVYYEGFEHKYPKYDNYDAIEVGKTKDIPIDYPGVMGVPITWLDKYNPQEFEILGLDDHRVEWRGRGPAINGKCKYRRIMIRNLHPIAKADDKGY